jgi:hypothetical protein
MTAWRKANPEKVSATKRKHYEKHREKIIARVKKLRDTYPERVSDSNKKSWRKHKEARLARAKVYRKAHPEQRASERQRAIERQPEKVRARYLTKLAINKKQIIKGSCVVCGEVKVHAHHSDYSQPLSVTWLCQPHHSAWHRVFLAS